VTTTTTATTPQQVLLLAAAKAMRAVRYWRRCIVGGCFCHSGKPQHSVGLTQLLMPLRRFGGNLLPLYLLHLLLLEKASLQQCLHPIGEQTQGTARSQSMKRKRRRFVEDWIMMFFVVNGEHIIEVVENLGEESIFTSSYLIVLELFQ
jgi:hypothetical protein